MVIIKKPTRNTSRQGKKTFLGVLAVLLAVLVAVSALVFALPIVSAKGESAFIDNECIFIDCRIGNNDFWDKDGAEIRVFTYYNDSDDANYCHEFEENFQNDNWFTGADVLQKGIKADKFCDHVYRFRIPSDKISHVRVVRTNSGATQKWNLTQYYMWDNQRTKTAGSKSNCIKIKSWGNDGYSPAEWTCFRPSNNASYSSKTANPDSTITGNSNLYTIDATFYDYYNDDEIQKGWRNINYESNHASVHYTKNNNWYWWAGYWEPFQYLNSKIAEHDSSVNYPLYFGNFYGKNDGYTGEGSSNLKNFNNKANNSNNIGGNHKSVAGLTGGTLDSNGNLVYATNAGYNSSTLVPFFDANFLSSNKVGSVVQSKFPMRKETVSGVTTYYFDSTSGKDNVWFNNLNTSNPTVSYAQNSKRAKDSLFSYSNQEASGWGFFPFDGDRTGDIDAKNYGFGMRVDVKFNLGENGKINGVDQKFNFTGDDDVWVYVDNKLILDLGGDHKKASGSINFATLSVTADTGNTFNNATRNTSFTLDNYNDPTAEHTLTMFYVERGMIESNLSFNFNFAPVGNEFIVDKTVNTTNINAGIKSAVAAADTFTFTQPTAAGKTTSTGTTIGSNGVYTLKNGQSISFKDQFTRGQRFTVTESESSPLDYTTTWSAKDLVMNESRGSGSTKEATFTYDTSNSSEFAMTRVQLSYVNTPALGSFSLTKTVQGVTSDTTDFNGTVEVSLDNGTSWQKYPLAYTIEGNSYTLTSGGKLATNGRLRHNRTLNFAGIPVGAKVRFTEDACPSGYSGVTTTGNVTVTASGNTIAIVNQKQSGADTITVKKTLDGQDYTGTLFNFELNAMTSGGKSGTTYVSNPATTQVVTTNVSNGEVNFSLNFTTPGNYRYSIKETAAGSSPDGMVYDTRVIYTGFNVKSDGGALKIDRSTLKFYTNSNFTTETTDVTFKNTVQYGEIVVNKDDQAGDPVYNTEFAVIKVAAEDKLPTEAQLNALLAMEEPDLIILPTTAKSGKAQAYFENLPIYQNGDDVYDVETGTWNIGDNYLDGTFTPQTYLVFEYSPTDGYNTNKTTKLVTFPYESQYAVTFDYTNVAVIDPASGGPGVRTILFIGFGVFGSALLMAAGYVVYDRRARAKRKSRHGRRYK